MTVVSLAIGFSDCIKVIGSAVVTSAKLVAAALPIVMVPLDVNCKSCYTRFL